MWSLGDYKCCDSQTIWALYKHFKYTHICDFSECLDIFGTITQEPDGSTTWNHWTDLL